MTHCILFIDFNVDEHLAKFSLSCSALYFEVFQCMAFGEHSRHSCLACHQRWNCWFIRQVYVFQLQSIGLNRSLKQAFRFTSHHQCVSILVVLHYHLYVQFSIFFILAILGLCHIVDFICIFLTTEKAEGPPYLYQTFGYALFQSDL